MNEYTVVISRSSHLTGTLQAPGPEGLSIEQCHRFEDELAEALSADGCHVLLVPHIYYLTPSHPAVSRLNQVEGGIILGSWLHPRAAYWTLQAHGIAGARADLPAGEASTERDDTKKHTLPEERTIHCYNLASFSRVESCVEEIRQFLKGAGDDTERLTEEPSIEEISGELPSRWYPVLDYSLCINCMQCRNFCLFGVYSLKDGRAVATKPDNCKTGCPACARVCPEGAIMFPHYASDPAIAGAPGTKVLEATIDIEKFFREQGAERPSPQEPCPACGCACDCERSFDGKAPPGKTVCPVCGCICDDTNQDGCCKRPAQSASLVDGKYSCTRSCNENPSDDLDDLIDALDELDES